jgi:hypothetical protein
VKALILSYLASLVRIFSENHAILRTYVEGYFLIKSLLSTYLYTQCYCDSAEDLLLISLLSKFICLTYNLLKGSIAKQNTN